MKYAWLILPLLLARSLPAREPDTWVLLRRRLERKAPRPTRRRILAFYYPWYRTRSFSGKENHWGKADPRGGDIPLALHRPLGGPYDSLDPRVVDRHLSQARAAGIDTFVASWWGEGSGTDRAFPLLLERAARQGMKVTAYLERVGGSPPSAAEAAGELLRLGRRYASHRAWLRLEGRPVLFLYGRALRRIGAPAWVRALETARKKGGADWVVLADGLEEENAAFFDGIHTYNPLGVYRGLPPAKLAGAAKSFMERVVRLARSRGKIACATLLPGYDDTKIRKPGVRLDRLGGRLYDLQWKAALEVRPDWVVITSFNEWHEGSEIEPSRELGDRYLEATARWARAWKKLPAPPERSRKEPPGLAALRKAVGKVKGRTGILGGFGGAAPAFLEAGASLSALEPGDLVSGKVRPDRFPLVVYCGGEEYAFGVKRPGDVPAALDAYLSRGGALLVFSTGPYPFYYDSEKKVVRAGEGFGLFLPGRGRRTAGPADFEDPPAGVRLSFRLSPLLSRLPRVVPFPSGGDRRWRAAFPPPPGKAGGEWIPLARLEDGRGRSWGEGIALCRRPGGGRLLYVWFRFGDMVPRTLLLADLVELLFP